MLASGAPGGVFELSVSDLPKNLQRIAGINSFYASAYADPNGFPPNRGLQGEIIARRIDGDLAKHYVFVYAKSDEGTWQFAGPFKKFDLHHVASASAIPVEELFGHHPLVPRNKVD